MRITDVQWTSSGSRKWCTLRCSDGWVHRGQGGDSREATMRAINELLARVEYATGTVIDFKSKAAGE